MGAADDEAGRGNISHNTMKLLVCFALLGAVSAATLPHTHTIPDTADVAAAKTRFFQLYREQAALAEAAPDNNQYFGPQATLNTEGQVENTADVQNAINAFYAAYQAQLAATGAVPVTQAASLHQAAPVHQQASFTQKYTGPYATINADGSVQKTVEVQAAANAFFQAYERRLAETAAALSQSAPQEVVAEHHEAAPINQRWTGPVAATVPAGVEGALDNVVNTPDVQAAAAEFFRAYHAQVEATRSVEASPVVYQAGNSQAFQSSPTVFQGHVEDPAAARSAHQQAFMHAIRTTGDNSPEGTAAKTALFNAYRNILQIIS